MKFTILTQYYPPEVGAPQRRLSELAHRMVTAGHDVTVLTAMPNYPTGRILQGYGGIVQRETLDGVKVIRTLIYPTQKASFLHRLTNYFSFVLSSALIGTFLLRRSDYLLVESPPLFLGLAAYWLSRVKRARLIFNVSDLWPESAVRLGLLREGGFSHRLSAWLESFCYRQAWLIGGQSQSILEDIRHRFPQCATFHLSNGVDVTCFGASFSTESLHQVLTPNDERVVLYAGLHGLAQGLDQIVDAARQLHKDTGLRFVLIGDGPEKQDLVAQASQLTNIVFKDPLPAAEMPPVLAAADIIMVPLKMHIPGAVPSKLYEAMASSKPVVLVAEGESADIVRSHGAGIVVQPGDIDGIVKAVQTLVEDPDLRARLGANGRQAVEHHFNRDTIVTSFIEYLEGNI